MFGVYFVDGAEQQQLIDTARAEGLHTACIYFNTQTFNSVFWLDQCATMVLQQGKTLALEYPPLPSYKTCVFDILAKFRKSNAEHLPEYAHLACGMLSTECEMWLGYEQQQPPLYRLNYYLGIYDHALAYDWVHPEFDRLLTPEEIEALDSRHDAAMQRAADWLYKQQTVAGESDLVFDIRGCDCTQSVFEYTSKIHTKRLVHPAHLELMP